jgi:hypothetical protein
MSTAARRHHDARLFLVALAFLTSAGFLLLHALATPGVSSRTPMRVSTWPARGPRSRRLRRVGLPFDRPRARTVAGCSGPWRYAAVALLWWRGPRCHCWTCRH